MTTVAIANQKGGVAKTTSAQALGVAMAERGRKVLLVDLDPQASLTWACGIDPDALEISIHDVLLKRAKVADVLVELDPPPPLADGAKPGRPGAVHLLPSTIDLAGAGKVSREGESWTLKADSPTATNSITDREHIIPVESPVRGLGKSFTKTFPALSITVLQFNVSKR